MKHYITNKFMKKTIDTYKINNLKKALIVYVATLATTILMGYAVRANLALFSNDVPRILLAGFLNSLLILFILFLCKKDNTDFKSLFYKKEGFYKSIVYGIILSFLFFILQNGMSVNFSSIHISGKEGLIFLNIINYFFIISFCEEFIFRGYMVKKLYICNKFISMLVIAFLFTITHLPFRMIVYNVSILQLLQVNLFSFAFDFIFHILMHLFYEKYNNGIGPVIVHFFINFFSWFITNILI